MNGNINFLFQERVFDLLGENPFATYRLDGSLDEAIAAGFDDDRFDSPFRVLFLEFGLNPGCLSQGQGTAPCSNPDELHPATVLHPLCDAAAQLPPHYFFSKPKSLFNASM